MTEQKQRKAIPPNFDGEFFNRAVWVMIVGFMNIKGQSGLKPEKQLQIEHFLCEDPAPK